MNSISFSSTFIPAGIAPPRRGFSISGVFPAASRVSTVAVRAAATPSKAPAEVGKRQPRGITKPMPVSLALQAVVGAKEIPRSQAVKQIWAYIKANNLQDPENKRVIICDEKLKNIFAGKDRASKGRKLVVIKKITESLIALYFPNQKRFAPGNAAL